ncbi:RdgB/HAM1 family non-canonical purine NTP pyrophosphatase [Fervidobacterium thailandense]|uniref:dITP/XTP pyrophosphatase n=1 Tax=Fervidobacterium thailandense TaxID=1008305 RepID=A0A1E3G4T4_9BACT|nr:RdgB/HAM1 family non-canonical purine NTP pyrophosphatase [Fervidobacterium thailandense]ODN31254.1 non-canonical purine NTP pyrophosphatase [Fervidobacterium thailandense]
MIIYVASKNPHKVQEIQLVTPAHVTLKPIEGDWIVDETGETFLENSVLKAIEYGKYVGSPVVSDDSGLSIDALDGFPGVMSARYLEGASYREKMESILELMKNVKDRRAKFVCCATYYDPRKPFLVSVQGEVHGHISYEIRGEKGFGYDPIFIPEGYDKTFGELGEDVKKHISHRSVAFKKLFDILSLLGII